VLADDERLGRGVSAPDRAPQCGPGGGVVRPLTPIRGDELDRLIEALRGAQPALAARSRDAIIGSLETVVEDWLAPASDWRAAAMASLPAATGFSPQMIAHALPTMLAPLRRPALRELVAREAPARHGLRLIAHVLPGNLPGLAAIPAALGLAVGSAVLLKCGRGDRVFPALFAASIAARDPALGACVAACYWPGGDRDCESRVLSAADLVVAAGDDTTIASLASRTHGRFVGYGHRVSVAVVARESLADAAAAAGVADDVALWDQRGCLSAQICFVEGDAAAATDFAGQVADALRPLAARLPPAAMSTAERLAVRRFRDEAMWRQFDGRGGAVFDVDGDGAGTVVVEPDPCFRPTPLCRSLRVIPVPTLDALGDMLEPVRGILEGAAVAASPSRWPALAASLARWGVHRVCPIGTLQHPPLDWRQGGRPRLGAWFGDEA
jgi:hypothetical protein